MIYAAPQQQSNQAKIDLSKAVRFSNSKIEENLASLRLHLGSAETMLQDEGKPRRRSNAFSDSEESDYEVDDCLDDITAYTDCLMDISPALECPAADVNFDGTIPQSETYSVSSTLAVNHCRKIRDRFPSLDIRVVEKLGEANARRSQRLHEMARQATAPTAKPMDYAEDASEYLFSDSGAKQTATTKSRISSGSIFSRNPKANFDEEEFDETASETTFATLSVGVSSIGQGVRRIPPLPQSAKPGMPFKCPLCATLQEDIRDRRAWK